MDDFVASGKDDARAAAWAELLELFDMGDPEGSRAFLNADITIKTNGAEQLLEFSRLPGRFSRNIKANWARHRRRNFATSRRIPRHRISVVKRLLCVQIGALFREIDVSCEKVGNIKGSLRSLPFL